MSRTERSSRGHSEATIAAVERETGLSKGTLRVWGRRYGFPLPARDSRGERVYPADQVEKLRVISRLLDRDVEIWAGGKLRHRARRPVAGVRFVTLLAQIPGVLAAQRESLGWHV
ncbi:MAG: MerR family transcriptional regulator [Gammaproteobacteria bacterium]|nr:MerR family transcriptional regulator [Gammaproteobacteria bacterium]